MSNDNFNNLEAARAEQERLRRQSAELQRDVAMNAAADQKARCIMVTPRPGPRREARPSGARQV